MRRILSIVHLCEQKPRFFYLSQTFVETFRHELGICSALLTHVVLEEELKYTHVCVNNIQLIFKCLRKSSFKYHHGYEIYIVNNKRIIWRTILWIAIYDSWCTYQTFTPMAFIFLEA